LTMQSYYLCLPKVTSYQKVISYLQVTNKENMANYTECGGELLPIRDALEVISGKWKLQIIIAIAHGNKRFREIERSIPNMTSKVLAKELKDLEEHELIKRTVYDESPVLVEYTLLPYADTLRDVINSLHTWGVNHRKRIIGTLKKSGSKKERPSISDLSFLSFIGISVFPTFHLYPVGWKYRTF
jgi:DNA-binding HxlR family transcriptional regulator